MESIEKILSLLKKGTDIIFEYNLCILGISPKKITAEFVGWNKKKHTMSYKKLYFEPTLNEGAVETIDYNKVSKLEDISHLANTGVR